MLFGTLRVTVSPSLMRYTPCISKLAIQGHAVVVRLAWIQNIQGDISPGHHTPAIYARWQHHQNAKPGK